MPPDELETFYRFIKLATNLATELNIDSASALRLYDSCIRQLQHRQSKEQRLRTERMMRGGHRLARITQNMYNLVDDYSLASEGQREEYEFDYQRGHQVPHKNYQVNRTHKISPALM